MKPQLGAFWSVPAPELLAQLETTPHGLTSAEAQARIKRHRIAPGPGPRTSPLGLFVAQFKSPVILILIAAALLSFVLHDPTNAFIILGIILVSGLLGFWQERGARDAVHRLLALVQVRARALRDGHSQELPVEGIVPGDIVVLQAGDLIPADCLILESTDLLVNEATLTGETFPVNKLPGVAPAETPLGQRTNSLFRGTHVVSGRARAVVVHSGSDTLFARISQRLRLKPPETEFERGVRRFGSFLMEVTLLLVLTIFAINAYLARPILDSFLFSLAIAVGLTPQLLPAIIAINLAHGTARMAHQKVIVKRLASIENFGSMNVLCSDKTGTLTEGVVRLHSALDIEEKQSQKVLFHAYLNASFQTGFANPIDLAIRTQYRFDISAYIKKDEAPYDFVRKRLSVLVAKDDACLMVTKGALPNVLEVCSRAETADGRISDIKMVSEQLQRRFAELSSEGFRLLGVACKNLPHGARPIKDQEADMTLLGFLVFFDPPKRGIADIIGRLKEIGVSLKIVTGDNGLVASHVARQVGFPSPQTITGPELSRMSEEALLQRVNQIDVFAEVEPNQKERLILALRKTGNVVGFMGDGLNDAPALHAADVSISVDGAADVAKEVSDIVLLEKDLGVLLQGVGEGRRTFANTLKYVFMATSANFGNMFSMAGASLFLPFLPLLPKQVLLTNLLTDIPEMAIATDTVDDELVASPRRWDIRFIHRFMITFGMISSVFDYLTFGLLVLVLRAPMSQFRTFWFLESVISASTIVLVIRSRKPLFASKPGRPLLAATLAIVGLTLVLPVSAVSALLGLEPLPVSSLLLVGGIVLLYMVAAETAKRLFYRRVRGDEGQT